MISHRMRHTICCLITFFHTVHGYKAVVISPVVDLVGNPTTEQEYREMPVCGGQKEPFTACKRGHQLLFNEVVDIVGSQNDQVCIAVPSIFYIAQSNGKKYNRYWAQKKHFMPLSQITHVEKIPNPYTPDTPVDSNTLALIEPFHHTLSGITYSAGTRFVQAPSKKSDKKKAVWLFNKEKKRFDITMIPPSMCYIDTTHTLEEKIDRFVQLVQQWAHKKHGYIPYIWGGSSCTHLAHSPNISEHRIVKNNKECSFYSIESYTGSPMSGFDCSSLIARAAQICGLPYYFKNTTTLASLMSELDTKGTVEKGDLIWIPWHVMIVSDVEKGLLVEARSYNHGFGKVHEIPLHKVFNGIYTYQELVDQLHKKKPLQRIDKDGTVRDTFPTFKILKMKSIVT